MQLIRKPARTMATKHERHRRNLFWVAIVLRLLMVTLVVVLLQRTGLFPVAMGVGGFALQVWLWRRHLKKEILSMETAEGPAQEKNEWRRHLDQEIFARCELRWWGALTFVLAPLFLIDAQVPTTVLAAATLSLAFVLLISWSRFYALPRLIRSREALL